MTLSNGDKIMLVEVPEDSRQHYVTLNGLSILYKTDKSELEIINLKEPSTGLGIFHKGEIDFEVKEGWVESGKWGDTIKYANYKWASDKLNGGFNTAKESFLSFLKSKQISTYKKYVVLLIKK